MRALPEDLRVMAENVREHATGLELAALAARLERAPVDVYEQLEELRRFGPHWVERPWDRLAPAHVKRLSWQPDGWAAVGIASVHRDGHVREAAVRALALRDEPATLGFLLVRLNDWVRPVRDAARQAVEARLVPAWADAWVRCLPLVEALGGRQRADHRLLVEAVCSLLCARDGRLALYGGLTSDDRRIRRSCYRLALGSGSDLLIESGLVDPDPVVRVIAVERACALKHPEQRRAMLVRALGNPTVTVRLRALRALAGERSLEEVEQLGLDESPAVRAEARWQRAIDWPARYRAALAAGDRIRGALAGLGEVGGEDDVLLLEPWISALSGQTRAAALTATAALDRESVSLFVAALTDPSKRVSRIAARVLARRVRGTVPDELHALAERSYLPPHTSVHLVEVVSAMRSWPRLRWLLRATRSANAALAELAAARVDPVTMEQPTRAELEAVEQMLGRARLPAATYSSVRRELSFWAEVLSR